MLMKSTETSMSLKNLLFRFKWRISLTFTLVLLETLLDLLYPLFIGWTINDLLNDQMRGVYFLTVLGITSLIVGSARRFYDTRIYAGIYQIVSCEMVVREQAKGQSVSTITARARLLTEFVEFLENSMPDVVGSVVGLAGVLIIIMSLNVNVFLACLALLALIGLIYTFTGRFNYSFNAGYNAELERQVDAIAQVGVSGVNAHFSKLMRWNIKLSDLETGNYFFIWSGVIALFVYTPITVIGEGETNYGLIFSLLMYVFDYIEKTATLPLYVQQLIRLKEISARLSR